MELRQLEQFVAVAELRSFTRAAERLSYVQSSLSAGIAGLERELGVRLFDRTTRRVIPTAAAEALLPTAREALAAAERMRELASGLSGVLHGTIRIGAMQALTFADIPALLGRFRRAHPAVEIEIHSAPGGSAALLEELRAGRTDLAFVGAGESPPRVSALTLGVEEMLLVGRPDAPLLAGGPVTLEALADAEMVEFPSGWGVRTVVDRAFADAGLSHRAGLEIADVPALLSLLREGLGVGVLPASLIPPGETRLRTAPITPAMHWRVVMARPSDRTPSPAARAFAALVEESVAAAAD